MILDLFAGLGGWDEGLRLLGVDDVVGIERDAAACATRAAAGHRTIRADVAEYARVPFRGRLDGLIASPPCQDFSAAGKRAGIEGDRGQLMWQVPLWVRATRPRWVACEQVPLALEWWNRFAVDFASLGYRTWFGVLNAADFGVPQTRKRAFLLASLDGQPGPPEATHTRAPQPSLFGAPLKPWVSMAEALGWSDVLMQYQRGSGMIDRYGDRPGRSEDEPAFTITGAALDAGGGAKMVVRTGNNSMVTGREGSRAGDGDVYEYERPITEPAPTLDANVGGSWRISSNNSVAGEGRAERGVDEPAFSVTSRADLWKLHTNSGQDEDGNRQTHDGDEPAPTFSAKAGGRWVFDRPATTIAGDPRVGAPGHRDRAGGERQFENAIRLTIADALVLQSFPPDYPVQGTKTAQFSQVGNAVCPRLAAQILAQFVGADAREAVA